MIFSKDDTKIVKAFGIFLMLYHHLFFFPSRIEYAYTPLFYLHGTPSSFLVGGFGKLCVGIFLFLGGYGTYKSFTGTSATFVKKKLLKLYKNFWKVFFIVVPISIILHTSQVTLKVLSFFLNIIGMRTSYNWEWWFIIPYILLTLISPLLIKLINNKHNNLLYSFIALFLFNGFILYIYPSILNCNVFDKYSKTLLHENLSLLLTQASPFICGMILARFDVLTKLKNKLAGNYLIDLIGIIVLAFMFILRKHFGSSYDFIFAPLFTICITIILCNPIFKYLKKALVSIGEQSTNIWLTHSFFCYMWCQKFIFMPKYSVLIFLLLLTVSYLFSIIITQFYKLLSLCFNFAKEKISFKHKLA